MRSSPILLALAAGLCGCVTSTNVNTNQTAAGGTPAARPVPPRVIVVRQVPHVFVAATGHRTRMSSFLSLNADCSLSAYYTVRVVDPPAHGTASVEQGRFYPNYPPANPRSACNTGSGDGMGLFYRSVPGYVGPDLLEVQAISPGGHSQLLDFHLDVR